MKVYCDDLQLTTAFLCVFSTADRLVFPVIANYCWMLRSWTPIQELPSPPSMAPNSIVDVRHLNRKEVISSGAFKHYEIM